MKSSPKGKTLLSTLGLLLITVWSAVQYLFYANVPDSVSTFAFVCITNLCGFVILGIFQFKHLKKITKKTIVKGVALSVILLLMNFFTILGSRDMDAVIISSVMSLYFIFVTPILLLMKKRVSFRSGVATVVALLALLLVFNANFTVLFASANIIYLILSDILFAAYIVLVSSIAEEEDPSAISVVQMGSCAVLALIAWAAEAAVFKTTTFTLPTDLNFWVSVLFIGIFIRALYTVIQFRCQRNLPPINVSLILSSEIVITLILNPLMCKLFGTAYEPATIFQIIGCVLFVIAVLICDDNFMRKFHYNDMDSTTYVDENGNTVQQVSLSRKIVNTNLLIGLGTLVVSIIVCLFAIFTIRNSVISSSQAFGDHASTASETALMAQVENELTQKTADKVDVAEERLEGYRSTVQHSAEIAGQVLSDPQSFPKTPVLFPYKENADIWTMQMVIADAGIPYEALREENEALGNMETLFASVQNRNPQLTTIYIGTEKGLMISYDPNSGNTDESGARIDYEFRTAPLVSGREGGRNRLYRAL